LLRVSAHLIVMLIVLPRCVKMWKWAQDGDAWITL